MIQMVMSKAFDKVNHKLLYQKLRKYYGFGGNIDGFVPIWKVVNSAQQFQVQHQILFLSHLVYHRILSIGPALFLLFVNFLSNTVDSSQVILCSRTTPKSSIQFNHHMTQYSRGKISLTWKLKSYKKAADVRLPPVRKVYNT